MLVAALALGPAGRSSTSAAPSGENAVVHWSGVAEGAIAAGRPPGSSSVLGGMVHGAMYDAVAAVEGGLDPFATGVTAPPDASADAAVAQAARDVLVARVPAQAASVQTAYDAYMASIPDGPAKDAGKAVGTAAAAGMLAMRTGDHFDDVVPYVQPDAGPGRVRADRADDAGRRQARRSSPVHVRLAGRVPARGPLELTSKRYARDVAEVQAARTRHQHRPDAGADRDGSLLHRAGLRPVQPHPARACEDPWPRPPRVRAAARLRARRDRGHDDRVLGGEVPLLLLAPEPRDPAGRHRREPGHLPRPDLAAARRRQPSGVSVRPRLLHRGRHRVAQSYFGTKRVELVVTSTVTGTTRTYGSWTSLVADVENARVWGGLHFRTTMTQTAKHFPRIARDVGRRHFLDGENGATTTQERRP